MSSFPSSRFLHLNSSTEFANINNSHFTKSITLVSTSVSFTDDPSHQQHTSFRKMQVSSRSPAPQQCCLFPQCWGVVLLFASACHSRLTNGIRDLQCFGLVCGVRWGVVDLESCIIFFVWKRFLAVSAAAGCSGTETNFPPAEEFGSRKQRSRRHIYLQKTYTFTTASASCTEVHFDSVSSCSHEPAGAEICSQVDCVQTNNTAISLIAFLGYQH